MKHLKLLFIPLILITFTGCFKKDNFEDITIYTTSYPIEYITNYLYGNYSNISSIYPNGVDIDSYELTNKQIKDYSSMDLYIFNGTNTKENDYVTSMFKYNKNLKIIDATSTMEYDYSENEFWLDPSNFLMLASNIKNGILEYTSNHYLKTEIENNYEELKLSISKIDANLKLIYENSNNKTLVVDNNALLFLKKYGFEIISLDEKENPTNKTILEVESLINSKKISYIFTTNKDSLNDVVNKIIEDTNVSIQELHTLNNLTDEERKNKDDYISLLNDNIELLKEELYD
jgi:zinc transport system substrate-binding protein